MKELTYFYLTGCPFCHKADQLIEQIKAQEPRLAAVPIHKIEESQEAALSDSYDYYYVPCFFLGDRKLFEGDPDETVIRTVLETAAQ
jgi:glutaredoxin